MWQPFALLSCSCRVPSEIHMAECYQSQQLCILARTHIQQCITVLPISRRNHQVSHGADPAGCQVYKNFSLRTSRNHSCSPSWATGRQVYTRVRVPTKRTTHTCNTHKQVIHRWHRQITCAVKKWKPVCYGVLSFFQYNFSCSLLNKKRPTHTCRIKLNHAAPLKKSPEYILANFRQWSKSKLQGWY